MSEQPWFGRFAQPDPPRGRLSDPRAQHGSDAHPPKEQRAQRGSWRSTSSAPAGMGCRGSRENTKNGQFFVVYSLGKKLGQGSFGQVREAGIDGGLSDPHPS